MDTTKLTAFAQAVGVDIKELKQLLNGKVDNATVNQLIEQAKTDFSFDRIIDKRQVEQALQSSCVLGSRLAIWMLKEANLKVYLYASEEVRAGRIFQREGGSLEHIKEFTAMRDNDDTRRYKELYNIDNTDYAFADMLIDTEHYTPDLIVGLIIDELLQRSLIVPKADT